MQWLLFVNWLALLQFVGTSQKQVLALGTSYKQDCVGVYARYFHVYCMYVVRWLCVSMSVFGGFVC